MVLWDVASYKRCSGETTDPEIADVPGERKMGIVQRK